MIFSQENSTFHCFHAEWQLSSVMHSVLAVKIDWAAFLMKCIILSSLCSLCKSSKHYNISNIFASWILLIWHDWHNATSFESRQIQAHLPSNYHILLNCFPLSFPHDFSFQLRTSVPCGDGRCLTIYPHDNNAIGLSAMLYKDDLWCEVFTFYFIWLVISTISPKLHLYWGICLYCAVLSQVLLQWFLLYIWVVEDIW